MALPSASEVPTTSPSHGSTSGGHVESYGAYRRKRYVLYHPRLHQPTILDRDVVDKNDDTGRHGPLFRRKTKNKTPRLPGTFPTLVPPPHHPPPEASENAFRSQSAGAMSSRPCVVHVCSQSRWAPCTHVQRATALPMTQHNLPDFLQSLLICPGPRMRTQPRCRRSTRTAQGQGILHLPANREEKRSP